MYIYNKNMSTIFDYIVVTAPSESIAKVYENQLALLQLELTLLHQCRIFCVADVEGKRMGSGGGTIHAIQETIQAYKVFDLLNKRTLVVHSGGDSRRAPFCSVVGKAWLNMNILIDEENVATPLLLLIKELSYSFKNLKAGSLVVSCSDVLLKLALHPTLENDGVYVVSVPAPISTAVNHGVLVCSSYVSSMVQEKELPNSGTVFVETYLQKPSLVELENYGATFRLREEESSSLIDTGIVIFVGAALSSLINFGEISNSERFELYTELLLACKTSSKTASFNNYLDLCGVNINDCAISKLSLLESLWRCFSIYNLNGIVIPNGSFTHLGTSEEIYKFLLFEDARSIDFDLHRVIKSINDEERTQSTIIGSFTMMLSIVPTTISIFSDYSILNEPNFVAASLLSDNEPKRCNFVVSHLYPSMGYKLPIASNFMLQQTFCHSGDDCASVMLLLHFSDDIKISYLNPKATIWGLQWNKFFKITECTASDIWNDGSERCLWNAKLFCVRQLDLYYCSHSLDSCISWPLRLLPTDEKELDENMKSSIFRWKNSPRLSLSDIIISGDATAMFHWRLLLNVCYEHFSTTSTLFQGRQMFHDKFALVEKLHKLWVKWYTTMDAAFNINLPKYKSVQVWLILFLIGRYYRNFSADLAESHPNFGLNEEVKVIISYVLELPDDIDITSICYKVQFNSCWKYLMEVIEVSKSSMDLTAITFFFFRNILRTLGKIILDDTIFKLLKFGQRLNPEEQPRLLFTLYSLMPDTKNHVEDNILLDKFNTQLKLLPLDFLYSKNENELKSFDLKSMYTNIFIENQTIVQNIFQSKGAFEMCIQQLIQIHIRYSLQSAFITKFPSILFGSSYLNEPRKSSFYNVCICKAPVRIDIAGGWSDTPPICYDQHGAVCNVAVKVDGEHPLKCASQIIPIDDNGVAFIRLRCYTRQHDDIAGNTLRLVGEHCLYTWEDLLSLSLSSPCALVQACLLVYKFDQYYSQFANTKSLSNVLIHEFAGAMDICSYSNLPSGSGMGGSSILAATILKSIDLLFLKFDSNSFDSNKTVGLTNEMLIYFVSQVEQRLTTGGGWQDQIGGNYPGFKIGRSWNGLPLTVQVEELPVSTQFLKRFEERTYLIFTGQQRLAKNTLLNALNKYSITCSTVVPHDKDIIAATSNNDHDQDDIVQSLIRGAEQASMIFKDIYSKQSIRYEEIDQDIDRIAEVLTRYWNLKVAMAPGSDPPFIRDILGALKEYCSGYALCGAGAGGFAAVILKANICVDALHTKVAEINNASSEVKLSIHSVEVDNVGLHADIIDNTKQKAQLHEYFCSEISSSSHPPLVIKEHVC